MNIFSASFTDSKGNYNKHAALAMTTLLIINLFFAGFSSMTVTSRIGFAMARDRALPFGNQLRVVVEDNKTPFRMILLVLALDILLCLLPLINELAFTAITSLTCIGY